MKYYLVCFIDYKNNDTISVKDSYLAKIDAVKRLQTVALEYVKEFQGKQQAEKCQVELSQEQLQTDTTLKEGLYVRKVDETVILYEKVNMVVEGKIWNSYDVKVNKIGLFTISEYNFENKMVRCNGLAQKPEKMENTDKIQTVNKTESNPSMFLDELKQLFMKGDSMAMLKKRKDVDSDKKVNGEVSEVVNVRVSEVVNVQVSNGENVNDIVNDLLSDLISKEVADEVIIDIHC